MRLFSRGRVSAGEEKLFSLQFRVKLFLQSVGGYSIEFTESQMLLVCLNQSVSALLLCKSKTLLRCFYTFILQYFSLPDRCKPNPQPLMMQVLTAPAQCRPILIHPMAPTDDRTIVCNGHFEVCMFHRVGQVSLGPAPNSRPTVSQQ